MSTNIKESGFETLIVDWLLQHNGYEQGANEDYNRKYAVDEIRLFRFLNATQSKQMEMLGIHQSELKRTQFLHRLQDEITKRVIASSFAFE
jgi:type I restriction enzyme R subunit